MTFVDPEQVHTERHVIRYLAFHTSPVTLGCNHLYTDRHTITPVCPLTLLLAYFKDQQIEQL